MSGAGLPRSTDVLSDGTPIGFRPITPNDAKRLGDAFAQLSPTSRYRRFLAPVRSLSDHDLYHFTHVDFIDHVAWVAELFDEVGRPLAGVGRWIRSNNDPTVAEIALTVIDKYQRQGLGTALLRLLAASAMLLGVQYFEATVLAENQQARSLLSVFGAKQVGFDMGAYLFRLPVLNVGQQPASA
jgi:RimJ/RimL family protein N-acetyltransferase